MVSPQYVSSDVLLDNLIQQNIYHTEYINMVYSQCVFLGDFKVQIY